jgi:hypothetical protein
VEVLDHQVEPLTRDRPAADRRDDGIAVMASEQRNRKRGPGEERESGDNENEPSHEAIFHKQGDVLQVLR